MFKELKKHVYIYGVFIKNCLIAQMEYRFNFYMSLLLDFAFLITRLLYVRVVYKTNLSVLDLNPDTILLFIGVFTLMSGVYAFFFVNNFFKISEYIRQGTLDILITKPISLQFFATLRYVDFGLAIPDTVGGLAMIMIACFKLNIKFSILNVLGFIGLILAGVIVMYSIFLLPHILSFWVVNTKAINNISDSLFEFNNMPMKIYSKWLQRIGVFVFPIFVITNFPSMFIIEKLGGIYAVWAIIAPVLVFLLVKKFWDFAVKSYSSVSC